MAGSAGPRRDWSRVWFAGFFLLLALSFAFATRPMAAQTLRISSFVAGLVSAIVAWREGSRGRGVLVALVTVAAALALPAPPVSAKEEGMGVRWLFIGLATAALVYSIVQVLRDGRGNATPPERKPDGA